MNVSTFNIYKFKSDINNETMNKNSYNIYIYI